MTHKNLVFAALLVALVSILALIAGIAFAETSGREPNPALMITASIAGFIAMFYVWIFWIVRLAREGDAKKLLLCILIPYVYAIYASVREVLRKPVANSQ